MREKRCIRMVKKKIKITGIDLMVTTACNLNCPGCYGHMDLDKKVMMDMNTAIKATEFGLKNRVVPTDRNPFSIVFFGGEPLLNMRLIKDYISWIEKNKPTDIFNYNLYLFTNGLLLDKKKIDYFRKHNVNIIISLDGPYDIQKIRRPMTLRQYKMLISHIKYAARTYNEGLKIYAVVENENIEIVDKIIEFIRSLGVTSIEFSHDGFRDWPIENRKSLYHKVKTYKSLHPEMSFTFNPESAMDCVTCRPKFLLIYPNGDVYDLCILCILTAITVHYGRVGKPPLKELDILKFGNLRDLNALYLDIEKKRKMITPVYFCPSIQRSIDGRLRELKETRHGRRSRN